MDTCTCLHDQRRAICTPPTPAEPPTTLPAAPASAGDAKPTIARSEGWDAIPPEALGATPAATSICENTVAGCRCLVEDRTCMLPKTTLKCLSEDGDGFTRTIRNVPPTHYTFEIQSFSTLYKSIDKQDSCDFEVDGYNWHLSLHPKGNKNKNVTDFISLYLVITEASSLPPNWEVNVIFRLFTYDQIRDKYLTVQDTNGRVKRFHKSKTEWGFDQFIPLSTFTSIESGFLVDDTCVFGAEVFVIYRTGKGERLSMTKSLSPSTRTWKITDFSRKEKDLCCPEILVAGDYKWTIRVYPKGHKEWKGQSLSLFLTLADTSPLCPTQHVYVEYIIRVDDQFNGKYMERKGSSIRCFSSSDVSWGWWNFMPLADLNEPKNGYLVNDTCNITAEVTVIGVVNKVASEPVKHQHHLKKY